MTKRNSIIISIIGATLVASLLAAVPVLAQHSCGGVDTSIINCGGQTGESAVFYLIKRVIQIMTIGIFVVAVGVTIFGGVLYSSSGGSPENIKKAKELWLNTVIGLLIYAFLVGITNFLIPGGVF